MSLIDGIGNETLTEKYYDNWALNYDQTLKNWNYKTPLRAAQAIFKIKDHINTNLDFQEIDGEIVDSPLVGSPKNIKLIHFRTKYPNVSSNQTGVLEIKNLEDIFIYK